VLPDDVLLEIFDFYRTNHDYSRRPVWKWHLLVHVCRRWRQVVFASPHRLKLQIFCTYGTQNLGIWPAFPIVLDFAAAYRLRPNDQDNIVAALEHFDRVCDVRLVGTSSQLAKMATAMRKPFPVLTHLDLLPWDSALVLPADFLGGSAPSLQKITLSSISFPELGTLLSSTVNLVTFNLRNIRRIGYISPETMVACLASLPKLEYLTIDFEMASLRPDRICPPPAARIVLPALTCFRFSGASEYLEDLVAHIDSPQLEDISIDYLNLLIDFAQLSKFIDRSVGLNVGPFRRAYVSLSYHEIAFHLSRDTSYSGIRLPSMTNISFRVLDWPRRRVSQCPGA
jgi:hypothetical protein